MSVIFNASTSSGIGISSDNSGTIKFQNNGTDSLILPTSGTITIPAGTGTVSVNGVSSNIVLGTSQASTSGTAIDFTGVPSWAKRITVMFAGVSISGSSNIIIRLGSGSVLATGYLGANIATASGLTTSGVALSTGFELQAQIGAADIYHGSITFNLLGSNTWVGSGVFGLSNSLRTLQIGGFVPLSGALDRIRITTINGTDTFDAGSINIMWE